MKNEEVHKDLVPFSNGAPLVPGRSGGSLFRWKLERDKQQLRDEILDLAKVIRRMSEELVDEIIFLRNPEPKTPEAFQRRMSQISGALKRESDTLTGLFNLADIHPALAKVFLEKIPGRSEALPEVPAIDLLAAPEPEPSRPPTLFDFLSNRDVEVLEMLLADMRPVEIARALNITRQTVHQHLGKARRAARELVEKRSWKTTSKDSKST